MGKFYLDPNRNQHDHLPESKLKKPRSVQSRKESKDWLSTEPSSCHRHMSGNLECKDYGVLETWDDRAYS